MEDLKLYLSDIVCATCLSSDRDLFYIKNVPHIQRLMPKLQFNMENDRICWECNALVMKFVKFQEKAFTSQEMLHDFVEGHVKLLQTRSNLKWVVTVNGEIQQRLDTSSKIEFKNGDEKDEMETVNLDEVDNSNIGYVELVEYVNEGTKVRGNTSNRQYTLDNDLEIDGNFNIPDDFEINDEDANKLINVTLKALLEDVAKKESNTNADEIVIYQTDGEDDSPNDNDCADNYISEVISIDDELKFDAKKKFKGGYKNISRKILKENERALMINREKQSVSYRNATFKCEKCVYGYDTADEYIDHMKKHDEKQGPEVCGICEQRFRDKATLTDHWSRHYTAFYCTDCGYSSRFLKVVVAHKDKNQCIKKENVWYQCDECSEEFALESLLTQHKNILHKVEYKCKYCDKSFTKTAVLKAHMQAHKPRSHLKCVICDQLCVDPKSLQVHMRIHRADAKKRMY